MEEDTTDSLYAATAGAPATFGSSVPTNQKKKWQYAYRLLKTRNLKEGAM
jgi:hypothetical protein